jgi:hypothetical protein
MSATVIVEVEVKDGRVFVSTLLEKRVAAFA